MYLYIILIAAALLIVVSIVVMTVFVIKNTEKKKEEVPSVGEKTEWEHIKDFSDINSKKSGKVNSFRDEFDDEVNTVGAVFSDYSNKNEETDLSDNNRNIIVENSDRKLDESVGNISKSDFINDFKTMSIDSEIDNIDYDSTKSFDDIDYDATRSLDDIQIPEIQENKIKVTLKYKDIDGLKIQRMDTAQITVGRGIGNDLLFRSDSFTSRNHAIFTIKDNELYIKDLNSKNGTFINKTEKVSGEVKIEESCEITFGDIFVEVIIEK